MAKSSGKVLVTGITGFIALQTAIEFLNSGYKVRGTLRSAKKMDHVKSLLEPHADISGLEFAEADLMADDGWNEAVSGCDFVAHLASPFPLAQPKNEDELIKPAVEGTLRVLRAAAENGVKRFIQTSSMVAVAYGHPHDRTEPFTEKDWSVLDGPGSTAYAKSKTLAEKAGRDFMSDYKGKMTYATVNPGFVLGPVIDKQYGSSAELVLMMLNGKYPGTPRLCIYCVDVRDVAKCHRLALEYKGNELDRFFAVDRPIWFVELAKAISDGVGEEARRVPRRQFPDFVFRLVGLFDPAVRAILPDLGKFVSIDNSATRETLKTDFLSTEEAAVATARSLIDLGLMK
ncbi:MAG: aldehyde reductase [Pseudomonadota bacterium]